MSGGLKPVVCDILYLDAAGYEGRRCCRNTGKAMSVILQAGGSYIVSEYL